MTIMEHAMQQAGIPTKTLTERVWLWLRDNPDHTSSDVARALGKDKATVAKLCSDMRARKMLDERKDHMRINRADHRSVQLYVSKYTVSPTMRGVYEVLPLPKREKQSPPTPVVVRKEEPPPPPPPPPPLPSAVVQAITVPQAFDPEQFVKTLNVKDAHALWQYLGSMFGSK